MKTAGDISAKRGVTKEDLAHEIEGLQSAVNDLALHLSTCRGSQLNYIWTNLAQARACLATALETTHSLKEGECQSLASDWQI